jgi:hypothetical protein
MFYLVCFNCALILIERRNKHFVAFFFDSWFEWVPTVHRTILYIYCMLVRKIWKCIHPRVSYSPKALPSGNMILVGEYIFIFPRVFSPKLSFFDRKRQRHSERITCRRPLQWFLNVWDKVPMELEYVCQHYFICMCFLGFIRYNKTF